jgi:hypothetical protein
MDREPRLTVRFSTLVSAHMPKVYMETIRWRTIEDFLIKMYFLKKIVVVCSGLISCENLIIMGSKR